MMINIILSNFQNFIKEHGADVIFLCLPNNPLGECLDKDDVYAFLETVDKRDFSCSWWSLSRVCFF